MYQPESVVCCVVQVCGVWEMLCGAKGCCVVWMSSVCGRVLCGVDE